MPTKLTSDNIKKGVWTLPSLLNGWLDYDTNYNSIAYHKDELGYVHLKGLARAGTIGQPAFVLPAGFRPIRQNLIATISNGVIARIDVYANGTVTPSLGSNAWFSFDNITFLAEQ